MANGERTGMVRVETADGEIVGPNWEGIASLGAKMALVMGALAGGVDARGKHGQGWSYATYSDVAARIRAAMATANLGFFASAAEVEAQINGKSSSFMARMVFTLLDGETGAFKTCRWQGMGLDFTNSPDKGLNKAYTSAEKYFLMRTFLVTSGDEPDPDSDDNQGDAAPAEHWSEKKFASGQTVGDRFVKYAEGQGVSQEALYAALEVESLVGLVKFAGSMDDAKAYVDRLVTAMKQAEPNPESEPAPENAGPATDWNIKSNQTILTSEATRLGLDKDEIKSALGLNDSTLSESGFTMRGALKQLKEFAEHKAGQAAAEKAGVTG